MCLPFPKLADITLLLSIRGLDGCAWLAFKLSRTCDAYSDEPEMGNCSNGLT